MDAVKGQRGGVKDKAVESMEYLELELELNLNGCTSLSQGLQDRIRNVFGNCKEQ